MRWKIAAILMTLLAGAGLAHGQERKSLDGNLRWALFQQYEAICKSFHLVHGEKADQRPETLLRDLKTPMPYVESSCVLAHRRAAEAAGTADRQAHFDPTYQAAERICKMTKRSGAAEGCEIESRRRAGEAFVRQAITKAACAYMLQAGSGSGFCLSIPGITGEEQRWAPFISAVFFDPNTTPNENIGCFSPGQEASSGKVPQALATLFAGDRTVAAVTERMARAGFECGDKACSRRHFTLYASQPAEERPPGITVFDEAPTIEIRASATGEIAELCLKRLIAISKRAVR